ncbi:hypothetical protein GCM10010191_11130 [Actinomadura vinacea]|uniref:SnoaL-like domain-containing protein n=1 Tax=Actinomadura vinacea TaxID=115336 RepID=A0ABN3IHL0_9ACTN
MSDELRAGNIKVTIDYINAINTWDFAAMATLLHPEAALVMPYAPDGFPRETRGRDAVIDFIRQVPDLIDPENLHDVVIHGWGDDPNELVAEYKSATRVKATGLPYANDYIVRITLADGMIIRFAEYYDPIKLVVALGGGVTLPTA